MSLTRFTFLILCAGISFTSLAQSTQTIQSSSFLVKGNCGMCKETIETAALIKGVRMATWNKETDSLKVVFKSNKVAEADIQKAVAISGYDTPLFKAEEVKYSSLPGCCAYREESEKH